ncbi:hypothetical protein ACHAAC_07555 [Aeromicrobium sp. CF4.19]|uniref:hypothetical protein n=1 Tax=Aeromicrobium sp. CF4.19 TaxID=3373082 RepID=UPI003EE697A2
MKLKLIIGFGIGYVLGTRAGRQRYEEIRDVASRVGEDQRVKDAAAKAEGLVRETVESARGAAGSDEVREAAKKAGSKVRETVDSVRSAAGSGEVRDGAGQTGSQQDESAPSWPDHPDTHVEVPEDEVVYSAGPESESGQR